MKLGISCSGVVMKYGYEKTFAMCKEFGFDTVDLSLELYGKRDRGPDIYSASQDEFEAFFTGIKDLADNFELEIASTHGRILTYTNEEAQCEYIRWVSQRDLAATRLLGAPNCVIHPIIRSYWPDRWEDEDFLYEKNTELYRAVLPFAEANDVKIALETMGRTKINDTCHVSFCGQPWHIQKQLDILQSPNMTVCVDTGHTNEAFFYGASANAGDMIRALGSNVTMLHMHDNNGTVDLHLDPMFDSRGGVDWADVFDALDEIGYTGSYNFELKFGHFGYVTEDALRFRGKYLRYLVENKGRITG